MDSILLPPAVEPVQREHGTLYPVDGEPLESFLPEGAPALNPSGRTAANSRTDLG